MADYRLYLMGLDNHFVSVIELTCENDADAIAASQEHLKGRGMELWCLGRHVARFPNKQEPQPPLV